MGKYLACSRIVWDTKLGPPVVPFLTLFGFLGSPTKIDKTERKSLVPTYSNLSNLEDLENTYMLPRA